MSLVRWFSQESSQRDHVIRVFKKKLAENIQAKINPLQSTQITSQVSYSAIALNAIISIKPSSAKIGDETINHNDLKILETIIRDRHKTYKYLKKTTEGLVATLFVLAAVFVSLDGAGIADDENKVTRGLGWATVGVMSPLTLIVCFICLSKLYAECFPPEQHNTSLSMAEINLFCAYKADNQFAELKRSKGLLNHSIKLNIEQLNQTLDTCDFGYVSTATAKSLLYKVFGLSVEEVVEQKSNNSLLYSGYQSS